MSAIWFLVTLVLVSVQSAQAQTSCAARHTNSGVFICYPGPAENRPNAHVSEFFHFSAQANAPDGHTIRRCAVLIDNHVVHEIRLPAPQQALSIETNLRSPFTSGSHSLRLEVYGVGSAEVTGIQFLASKDESFCDPFSRFDPRACAPLRAAALLRWSPEASRSEKSTFATLDSPADALAEYGEYAEIYDRNLRRLEADVSDAMAVDGRGNLYVASHVVADVELRKYTPDGTLAYDSLVRSCGAGFLSLTGIAVGGSGLVWIAGNTTACMPGTTNAFHPHVEPAGALRGFVMLLDTTKPSATPLYVTYLSNIEYRINGIRVDRQGNTYATGVTNSLSFPHESMLDIAPQNSTSQGAGFGFVSVLNAAGSGLQWSTLLRGAQLTALSLGDRGKVYLAGRAYRAETGQSNVVARSAEPCGGDVRGTHACDDLLVAELSKAGRELSYVGRLRGAARAEGRAISTIHQSDWVLVAGVADSSSMARSPGARNVPAGDLRGFVLAVQTCRAGLSYRRPVRDGGVYRTLSIVLTPALDAFAGAASGVFQHSQSGKSLEKSVMSIQTDSACHDSAQP